jgi:hypothetical protein
MENDSSVFHRLRGLANACLSERCLIPHEALPDKALPASGKVFRAALREAETLRPLHEVKSACAIPRA